MRIEKWLEQLRVNGQPFRLMPCQSRLMQEMERAQKDLDRRFVMYKGRGSTFMPLFRVPDATKPPRD